MEEIAKSVIVRADDRGHLIEYIFHLSYQRGVERKRVKLIAAHFNEYALSVHFV